MFTSKLQALFLGFLLGAAALAFGIYKYFETQSFFNRAKEATAYITDVTTKTESKTENGSKTYYEKTKIFYEYSVDGKTYKESDESTSGTNYVEGESFTIYYDPENPQDGRRKREASSLPWLCIGFGVIALGGGIHFFMKKSAPEKKKARA